MAGRIFAIGDIHGCIKSFKSLIYSKLSISLDDSIYLLGDYIDRGPDSKAVVDEIILLIEEGYDVKPLRGNHEQLLVACYKDSSFEEQWRHNGSKETLASFGVMKVSELDSHYLSFFESLDYYFQTDKFIITHGGLNFEIDNPLTDLYSMVWERNDYVDRDKIQNRRLIVGHTPSTLERIRQSIYEDRILLDGGCVYYKRYPDYGYLVALEFDSMKLTIQRNIDYDS